MNEFPRNVSGNSLRCDCELRWLLDYTDFSSVIGTCGTPDELRGLYLEDVDGLQFLCGEFWSSITCFCIKKIRSINISIPTSLRRH